MSLKLIVSLYYDDNVLKRAEEFRQNGKREGGERRRDRERGARGRTDRQRHSMCVWAERDRPTDKDRD